MWLVVDTFFKNNADNRAITYTYYITYYTNNTGDILQII